MKVSFDIEFSKDDGPEFIEAVIGSLRGCVSEVGIREVMKEDKSLTVKEASKILGKSEMFIRIGLRNKNLPIGTAVLNGNTWCYHVSQNLLNRYLGLC